MRRILYWLGLVDLVWVQSGNDRPKLRIVQYAGEDAYAKVEGYPYTMAADGRMKDTSQTKWFDYDNKPNTYRVRGRGALQQWRVAAKLKGN